MRRYLIEVLGLLTMNTVILSAVRCRITKKIRGKYLDPHQLTIELYWFQCYGIFFSVPDKVPWIHFRTEFLKSKSPPCFFHFPYTLHIKKGYLSVTFTVMFFLHHNECTEGGKLTTHYYTRGICSQLETAICQNLVLTKICDPHRETLRSQIMTQRQTWWRKKLLCFFFFLKLKKKIQVC